MIVSVTQREFSELSTVKEKFSSTRIRQMHVVSAAIAARWVSVLSHYELIVLLAIMARTLSVGRAAVRVGLKEFTEPSEFAPDSSPLQCSVDSVRRAVHSLSDKGILTVYAPTADSSRNESDGRLYEIDFKVASCGLQQDQNTLEIFSKPPSGSARPPLPASKTPYCIHHELGKPNKTKYLVASLRSRTNVVEFPLASRQDNALDVINAVKDAHRVRRATLVAQALSPQRELRMDMVQAVIDKIIERDFPGLPRVVVTKEAFGVMRKRIKAYKVDNFEALVEYSFSQWSSIASRQRLGLVRDSAKAAKFSPLPLAPSFRDLAYRLPYFIALYANRKAGQNETLGAPAEKSNERERQLEREVRSLEGKLQTERTAFRRVISRRPAPRVEPETTTSVAEQDIEWVPPVWEPTQKRRSYGK